MPWTTHGYWTGLREPTYPGPPRLDCGGPHRCVQCALEAHRLEAETAMSTPLAPAMELAGRHAAVVHLGKQFAYDHLPTPLQAVSKRCHALAAQMIAELPDGPELSFGLRQLLLAKDAFVRCAARTGES